ncbi:hypothetical protein HMPREF3037_01405 [Candidatus Stoquefichus sp. KLE1796]|nr:hypothetical protein HMPREF3037_01405 [Candidatus Stoquefichus sp. KLE1796]
MCFILHELLFESNSFVLHSQKFHDFSTIYSFTFVILFLTKEE